MISWKWISIGLAILCVWMQANLWIGQGSIAELVTLHRQIDHLNGSNTELRARNQRLEVEVAEFKNGLDSVDEMAREELGMVKDGETFYVVVKR